MICFIIFVPFLSLKFRLSVAVFAGEQVPSSSRRTDSSEQAPQVSVKRTLGLEHENNLDDNRSEEVISFLEIYVQISFSWYRWYRYASESYGTFPL